MTFLIFLFPIAVYCLILAHLNRKRHPILVPGTWDFAGVLLAASGFLLMGGPSILNGLYDQNRLAWVLGRPTLLPGYGGLPWAFWASGWVVYFAAVVGGSAWLIARRRHATSIYNVEPHMLSRALDETLHRLGRAFTALPDRVIIHAVAADANGLLVHPSAATPASQHVQAASASVFNEPTRDETEGIDPQPSSTSAAPLIRDVVVEVDTFPAMRHVTLCWQGDSGLIRAEVEAELSRVLKEVESDPNPVAAWLLGIALVMLCVNFLGLALLLFLFTRLR